MIRRAFRIILASFDASVSRMRLYKADIVIYTMSWIAFTILLFIFWTAVISNFTLIGFTDKEALEFIGMYYVAWGLVSYFWGVKEIGDRIVDGTLDVYLTKPAAPITLLVLRRSHGGVLIECIIGMLLIGIAFIAGAPLPTFINALMVPLTLIEGVGLTLLFYGTLNMLSFFLGRVRNVQQVLDYFYEYTYYPTVFMQFDIGELFKWGIPLAFLVTMPSLILMNKIQQDQILLTGFGGLILLVAWFTLFALILRAGLRRYESAGG